MALFVGEFDQVVDVKHRLAIPSPLREQLVPSEDGENFYLVLGPDRHLWLYPDLFYRRMLSPMQTNPLPSRKAQRLDLLYALARVVKPDAQGRVVLPEKSMERAVMTDPAGASDADEPLQVTLVGKGDHIEIWPKGEWERHVAAALPHYGQDVLDAGDGMLQG